MTSRNKSLNCGLYVPNDQVLNQKIHQNPRYQHITSAINTGSSVRRHIDELKEKQKNCYHKKDEVFNRIKFTFFIELKPILHAVIKGLLESAKIKLKSQDIKEDESIKDNSSVDGEVPVKKSEGLVNVIMGIGEIDIANERKKPSTPVSKIEKDLPYLLLDVREREQFLQNHIKTAKHYPSALLARSVGYETEELKLYKNSSPELIILYDDDESIASRVATTLVQRGYDNVFLLTGGLKYISDTFPKKPMSTLCSTVIDHSQSVSSEFSEEDIYLIEQYVDSSKNSDKTKSFSSFSTERRVITPKSISLTDNFGSSCVFTTNVKVKSNKSTDSHSVKRTKPIPWR